MARLFDQREQLQWPAELATFDPQRHGSRASWHLARCHAAKTIFGVDMGRKIALEEIRASLGTGPSMM